MSANVIGLLAVAVAASLCACLAVMVRARRDGAMNWFKFWVHAICGVVLGLLVGNSLWTRFHLALSHSSTEGIIIFAASAVVCGLGAGCLSTTDWDERL